MEMNLTILDQWNPTIRPQHCSNCYHAKVIGWYDNGDCPAVSCSQGHGRATLTQLIRPCRPHGFREASKCPEFEPAG